jgi:membrane fusion protein, macrolide-specific efflux system
MKIPWSWPKEHKIVTAAVAVFVVVAVILAIRSIQSRNERLTEPLKKGSIIESVYGIGTVSPNRRFDLKVGVTSTIRRLYVQEGDQVKRAQPLVQLDDVIFNAPFAGTITSLPFKVGETVFAATPVLSVVDLRDRYLVVSLEQRGALRVRPGQKARISFDSMRGEAYGGEVESVYSHDNNFLVRIDVSSLPPQILPGMTADVAVAIAERRDVLLAPAAAIDAGKVYVRRGPGRPRAVEVKIGIVDGTMAEIVAGDVHEGDRLVIPHTKR